MPPQLRLYDYLQRRKERKPAPVIDLKISKIGNVSSQHTQDLTSMYTLFTYADKMESTEAVYYLVALPRGKNSLSIRPPTCLSITALITFK